jgi:hypothetical protein
LGEVQDQAVAKVGAEEGALATDAAAGAGHGDDFPFEKVSHVAVLPCGWGERGPSALDDGCWVEQFFLSSGMAMPSLISFHLAAMVGVLLRSVAGAGAGHDGDDVAGLVPVDGLARGDEHLAEAALALFVGGDVGGRGEDVPGADVVEVFDFGAAVKDAGRGRAGC